MNNAEIIITKTLGVDDDEAERILSTKHVDEVLSEMYRRYGDVRGCFFKTAIRMAVRSFMESNEYKDISDQYAAEIGEDGVPFTEYSFDINGQSYCIKERYGDVEKRYWLNCSALHELINEYTGCELWRG